MADFFSRFFLGYDDRGRVIGLVKDAFGIGHPSTTRYVHVAENDGGCGQVEVVAFGFDGHGFDDGRLKGGIIAGVIPQNLP